MKRSQFNRFYVVGTELGPSHRSWSVVWLVHKDKLARARSVLEPIIDFLPSGIMTEVGRQISFVLLYIVSMILIHR